MASYTEIASIFGHDELRNRIQVACLVAAETVVKEDSGTPNHANRLLWAKGVFMNSRPTAEHIMPYLLAANRSATVQGIIGATDAVIQTAVDGVVDVFATGGN